MADATMIRCSAGGDNLEAVAENYANGRGVLAMRRGGDSSWRPFRISLRSDGQGVDVEFQDDGRKMVILSKEEAIGLLRIRSDPLKGEDCSLIRQGDRVLATPKPVYNQVFFEAIVEKRMDAKHSKKRCTCSFMVRWTTGQVSGGGTTALPLSAMVTMPATRIDIHPAIKAFFSNVSRDDQTVYEEDELPHSPSVIEADGSTPEGASSTQVLSKNIAAKKGTASCKKTVSNSRIVKKLFPDDEEPVKHEAKRKLLRGGEKSRKSARLNRKT